MMFIIIIYKNYTLVNNNTQNSAPSKIQRRNLDAEECKTFNSGFCVECVDVNAEPGGSTTCVCKDTYYNDGSKCDNCSYKCLKCNGSATNCTQCKETTRDPANQCECLTKHFEVKAEEPESCTPCNYKCQECDNSADVCSQCATNSNRSGLSDCLCSNGFYEANSNDVICTSCSYKCSTCSNGTSCDICVNSNRTEPNCNCKTGFYEDGSNNPDCGTCNYKCQDCIDGTTCATACSDTTRDFDNECKCKDKFYDIGVAVCSDCDYKCGTCETTSTQCLTCSHENRDDSQSCACKTGYIELSPPNPVCTKCNYKCLTCQTTLDNCQSCPNATRSGSSCDCVIGKFEQGGDNVVCGDCFHGCTACSGSQNNCETSCSDTNRNGIPTCACSPGFFEQNVAACGECNYKCSTCENSATNCTNCSDPNREKPNCLCKNHWYEVTANQSTCSECNFKCGNCSGTSTSCSTCSDSTRDDSNSCLCKNGFYQNGSNVIICEQCKNKCLTCENNSDECLTCKGDRVPNGTNCECPVGKYDDGTSENCQTCPLKCGAGGCNNATECTSDCSDSNREFSKIDTGDCLCKDTFYDNQTATCQACSHKCNKCTDFSTCIDCSDTSTRKPDATCDCNIGFIEDGTNAACRQCHKKCKTCNSSDPDLCILCAENSYREGPSDCNCTAQFFNDANDDCQPCEKQCDGCSAGVNICDNCFDATRSGPGTCNCISGYTEKDPKENSCLKCNFQCAECQNGDADDCTSCVENTTRKSAADGCVCKDQYFQVGTNAVCNLCNTIKCAKCITSATNCTECTDPTTRDITDNCNCRDTFYESNVSVCLPCVKPCVNCTTSSNCTSCISELNRKSHTDNCVCQDGFYDLNDVCTACENQCTKCDTSASSCISCKIETNRSTTAPGCACNPGFYDEQPNPSTCKQCEYPCQTCFNTATNCINCYNGINTNRQAAPDCNCSDGAFKNTNNNNNCDNCQHPCDNCTAIDVCTTCVNPDTRKPISENCVCRDGTYDLNNICENCNHKCATCNNGSTCLTCNDPTKRKIENDCNCIDTYYDDGSSNACIKCPYQCLNCTSATQCTSCAGVNRSNTPSCACDDGWFDDGQVLCKKCSIQCETCVNSSTECTQCVVVSGGNNRLQIPKCECQDQFYHVITQKACLPCEHPCLSCVSKTDCLSCRTTNVDNSNRHDFNEGGNRDCTCVDEYYEKLSPSNIYICEKCQYPCLHCSDQYTCTLCKNTIDLRIGVPTCLCKKEYFDNNSALQCQACEIQCEDCDLYYDGTNLLPNISSKNCLGCSSQTRNSMVKVTQGSNKYLSCPCLEGYIEQIPKKQDCIKCNYKCYTCDTSVTDCLECSHETRNLGSNCSCKSNYYEAGKINCLKCSFRCLECSGSSTSCDSCPVDSNRTGSECICQNKYFEKNQNSICFECGYKCDTCISDALNCITCAPPTGGALAESARLNPPSCYCPQGYFDDGFSSNCQKCATKCGTCSNVADNCLTCSDSSRSNPPYCNCSTGQTDTGIAVCTNCSYKCKECLSEDITKCKVCSDPTRTSIPNCDCDFGYYEDNNNATCKKCESPCLKCNFTATNCLQCILDSKRKDPPSCGCFDGYYENQQKNCVQCVYPCNHCFNEFICKNCVGDIARRNKFQGCSCNTGFFDYNQQCIDKNNECSAQCNVCDETPFNCTSCQDPTKRGDPPLCECKIQYYTDSQNLCQSCDNSCLNGCKGGNNTDCNDCRPTYYKDLINSTCEQCIPPCLNCESALKCLTCLPRNNINGPPNCDCLTGFFENNGQCVKCDYPCNTCINSSTQCISCTNYANRDSAQNGCICKDGFYDDLTNCQLCSIQCSKCTNTQTQCTQCSSTATRQSEAQGCICKSGFFEISQIECQQCSYKCTQCTSLNVCQTCSDSSRSGQECNCTNLNQFDDGSSIACQDCDYQCQSCSHYSDFCLECSSNNRINPPICKCKEGMFDQSEICVSCNLHLCLTCENNDNECITCSHHTRINPPDCDCKLGFYNLGTQSECVKCVFPCETCTDSTTCLTCQVANNRKDHLGNCICEDGYYEHQINKQCLRCSYPCETCNQAIICLTCISDIQNSRQTSNPCQCISHYYDVGYDENDLDLTDNCQLCDQKCNDCTKQNDNCIDCAVGSFRDQPPQCNCQLMYYEDVGSVCQPCDKKCLKCEVDASSCTKCYDDTRDINNNCICKVGYIEAVIPDHSCIQCDYPCLECSGTPDNCINCSHDTRINAPTCNCIAGLINNIGVAECKQCLHQCDTCNPNDAGDCIVCSHLTRGSAPQCDCKDGYFDQQRSLCSICQHPCVYCESIKVCKTCAQNGLNREAPPYCTCLSGFYDNSSKECVACIHPCLTCKSEQYCLTCVVRSNINDFPSCTCKDGFYEDTNQVCQQCSTKCKTCTDFSNCIVCVEDGYERGLIAPDCQCNIGYYNDANHNKDCIKCNYKCEDCIDGQNCLNCKISSFRDINNGCTCIEGYFDVNQSICIKCNYKCKTCSVQETQCGLCSDQNRINSPICNCKTGYYDNGNEICQQCQYPCLQCDSQNTCTVCIDLVNRNLDCSCQIGFYDNGTLCEKCDLQCVNCEGSKSNCTVCQDGFQRSKIKPQCGCNKGYVNLISLNQIDCVDESMCQNIYYDLNYINLDIIELDFQSQLEIIANTLMQKNTNLLKTQYTDKFSLKLCNILFDQRQFLSFGQLPQCKLSYDYINYQVKIQIQLTYLTTFKPQDKIIINEGIFVLFLCKNNNVFIKEITQNNNNSYLNYVNNNPPSSKILGNSVIQNCEYVELNLSNIQNDGQRQLKNIQWKLVNTSIINNKINVINSINKFMTDNLQLNGYNFKMIANDLQVGQTYDFQVYFENFLGVSGTSIKTIQVLSQDTVQIEIVGQQKSFIFNKLRQESIQFKIDYISCSQDLNQLVQQQNQNNNDLIEYSIQLMNSDYSQILKVLKSQQRIQQLQSDIVFELQAQNEQYLVDTVYYLQIIANTLNNKAQKTVQNLSFIYEKQDYVVYIKGGSKQTQQGENLILKGKYFDPNVISNIKQDGFTFNWQCLDNDTQSDCILEDGSILIINNSDQDKIQIDKQYQFAIGQKLIFIFTVTKDGISKSTEAVIEIIEKKKNYPNLDVQLSEWTYGQKIRVNEKVQIDVLQQDNNKLHADSEYLLTLIYDDQVIVSQTFYYSSFNFRIMDLFNDFDFGKPYLQFMVTVKNENFDDMITKFDIEINFPPQNGIFQINQTQGISMNTVFDISSIDFSDTDYPLQYKYVYYLSKQDYEEEIMHGLTPQHSKAQIIQDFTVKNSIQTVLPSGFNENENNQYEQEIILMIIAADSYGTTSNITQAVKINPVQDANVIFNQLQNIYQTIDSYNMVEQVNKLNMVVQELNNNQNIQNLYKISSSSFKNNVISLYNNIFSKLENLKEQIDSLAIQNQIQNSLNIILNFEPDMVCKKISLKQKIKSLKHNLKMIRKCKNIQKKQYGNEGDNVQQSQSWQRIRDIEDCINTIFKIIKQSDNIICKNKNSNNIRILDEQDENINSETSSLLNDIIQESSQIYLQFQLPNQNMIEYKGNSLNLRVQRQSQSQAKKMFVQELSPEFLYNNNELTQDIYDKYYDLQQGENNLVKYSDKYDLFDINSTKEDFFLKAYAVQFQYYPENLDKNSGQFQYSEQDNSVQELIIQNIDEDGQIQELYLKQGIYTNLIFEQSKINGSYNQQDLENNICIQQNQQNGEWTSDTCQTNISIGNGQILCQCNSIGKTTVVNDINNIYLNKPVPEIIEESDIMNSWLIYVLITIFISEMIFLLVGNYKDNKQLSQIQPVLEFQKEKEKKIIEENTFKMRQTFSKKFEFTKSQKGFYQNEDQLQIEDDQNNNKNLNILNSTMSKFKKNKKILPPLENQNQKQKKFEVEDKIELNQFSDLNETKQEFNLQKNTLNTEDKLTPYKKSKKIVKLNNNNDNNSSSGNIFNLDNLNKKSAYLRRLQKQQSKKKDSQSDQIQEQQKQEEIKIGQQQIEQNGDNSEEDDFEKRIEAQLGANKLSIQYDDEKQIENSYNNKNNQSIQELNYESIDQLQMSHIKDKTSDEKLQSQIQSQEILENSDYDNNDIIQFDDSDIESDKDNDNLDDNIQDSNSNYQDLPKKCQILEGESPLKDQFKGQTRKNRQNKTQKVQLQEVPTNVNEFGFQNQNKNDKVNIDQQTIVLQGASMNMSQVSYYEDNKIKNNNVLDSVFDKIIEKQIEFKDLPFMDKIKNLHQFLAIFYVFTNQITRVWRYLLYFQKIFVSIGITSFLLQNAKEMDSSFIISILILQSFLILINLFVILGQKLLVSKHKNVQIFILISLVLVFGCSIWAVFWNISYLYQGTTNRFGYAIIITLLFDLVVTQFIMAIIKVILIQKHPLLQKYFIFEKSLDNMKIIKELN